MVFRRLRSGLRAPSWRTPWLRLVIPLVVLPAAIVTLIWVHPLDPQPTTADSAPAPVPLPVPVPVPAEATHFRRLQRAPRPESVLSRASTDEALAPDACRAEAQALLALDLDDVMSVPPRIPSLPPSARCPDLSGRLNQLHGTHAAACAAFALPPPGLPLDAWVVSARPCLQALALYRSSLVDELTRDLVTAELADPALLADRLVSRLYANDFEAAEQTAQRLLALDAGNYPAAKALLLIAVLTAGEGAHAKPDDPLWARVDAALAKARAYHWGDEAQLAEIELIALRQRSDDFRRVETRATEISGALPTSGVGPYYMAWAYETRKDRVAALAHTGEAVRREPREQRFATTRERLEASSADDPADQAFTSDFSLDLFGGGA